MARGVDHLNDPRWEGQDSQSLPDRPAHPDPSRVAEFGDPAETPSHGIPGYLELKHGLRSEDDVLADRAASAQVQVDELETERSALQTRADAGDEKAAKRLKGVEQSLKHAQSQAKGAPEARESLADKILSGEIVPSIEQTSGDPAGKRDDRKADNAPQDKK